LVMESLNFVSLSGYFGFSLVSGVLLAVIAAIYPASFASKMVPATALRSNI
jgi:ABC-type antimicrobial peptide transport system permease subunit